MVPFGLAGTESVMLPYTPADFHGLVISGIPVSLHRRSLAIAFGAPLVRAPDESPQAFATRLEEVSFTLTRRAEQALSACEADGPSAETPDPRPGPACDRREPGG